MRGGRDKIITSSYALVQDRNRKYFMFCFFKKNVYFRASE